MNPIIEGKVVRGDGYGKKLGFPTANLDCKQFVNDKMELPLGVYAGVAYLNQTKKIRKAAIVISPIDNKKPPKIEAHILDFKGRLYGKKLTLRLYKFLRPFAIFKTERLLVAQIRKDIKRVEKQVVTPT